MKILKSLPDINQKDFFNRYANLIPTLFWLGVLAQLISGLTEISIIYNIINTKLLDLPFRMAADTVTAISWTGAIIGSLFFEVGLRKFIPYAVRCFLFNRWQGLDRAMSLFILLVAALLVGGSVKLSYSGSKELVSITSLPQKEASHSVDMSHTDKVNTIRADYKTDSTNVADTYGAQLAAVGQKYKGLIGKQQSDIALFERKEQRTGNSYKSRKQVHKGNIAKLQSEQAQQIADLQAAKRNELTNVSNTKRTATSEADHKHNAAVAAINSRNKTAVDKAEKKSKLYGGGLALFTVLCMVVFILSVIISEIHQKGSGIVEQVIVNQYDFSNSAFSRFFSMLKEKWQSKIHSKITEWEKTTPAPTLPIVEHQLFDLGKIEQERIIVEVEKVPGGKYIIPSRLDKSQFVVPDPPKEDTFQDGGFSKNKTPIHQDTSAESESTEYANSNNLGSTYTVVNTVPLPTKKTDTNTAEGAYQNETEKRPIVAGFLPQIIAQNKVRTAFQKDTPPNTTTIGDIGNIPPDSPINRITNKKDIDKARLNIDRSKKRYTEKQRKRVKKFYEKYKKKHGKKPSYGVIAVGLELGERAVGEYVRYLKREGHI